jgi:hypothetical protein
MTGWTLVSDWIQASIRDVVVLPPRRGEETLAQLEVTKESTLGAITLNTGGILVDHGWIRILGGGSDAMLTVGQWAAIAGATESIPAGFVAAYDAVGGFYVADGAKRTVLAFMPDTLDWLDTNLGYSDFVHWTLHGDTDAYYQDLRWDGWETETAALTPDRGLSLYPPPFTEEGKDVASASRQSVPMQELWDFYVGRGLLERTLR